ncbi:hypothetical protein [Halococcus sp. IIIV-5B]|uniref:hypothetical protein n=1 Tax=Halococcus sp. IIIV-5B TaxID=2321230 RepID=UPI0018F3CF0D|nr:hypothetical protein [Halococcus sp. IIIV-5B]
MVDDVGCDPTGSEPCDDLITDAADDYTLLKFPPGEYKLTQKNVVLEMTNIGFFGEGDVAFKVPTNFNQKALVVDRGTGVLFEGIDIDLTASGATPGLHLGADDDLEIHDVEFIGQGIHPDSDPRGEGSGNPEVTNALSPIVRSSDGVGRVTNVVAKNAGLMGAYNRGSGRIGIWVGIATEGTITFENCHISGYPNNSMYCSRTYGVVQVEGGVFRNNDITQVRIGSRGSYVDGATIEVDMSSSDSPNPNDMLNGRGVRLEVGSLDTAGPVVRNCDVVVADASHSSGGVVASADIGRFEVANTRIRSDVDGVRGLLAKDPTGGAYSTDSPYDGTVQNVSIVGSADGSAAIEIRQRPGVMVEGCCIESSEDGRDGLRLVDSDGCVVRDCTINTTGRTVVRENSAVDIGTISNSGTCPVPTTDDTNPDTPSGNTGRNVLTIEGATGADYELAVSGDLEQSTAMSGATADPNDTIDGKTATGQVDGGGRDSYAFSGEIARLRLDGGANLYYNEDSVDPATYLDHTLTIESESRAEYTLVTSDGVVKSASMDGATVDPNDGIENDTVTGQVGDGGRDSYAFPGEVVSLDVDGDATVYRDGQQVDPTEIGSSVLTIEGAPETDYELGVSGDLEKSTAMTNTTIDDPDTLDGSNASGHVDGGRDSYEFSGEITRLVLDGGANLYYNGEMVDPSRYLPDTISIDGAPGTEYEIATTDGIVKSTVVDGTTVDPNDDIDGTTATGQVGGGGRDSYAILGEITRLRLDGGANLYYNEDSVDPATYLDHTLTIESESRAEYTLVTSDGVVKSTSMDGATVDPNDGIENDTVTGQVGEGGRDSYAFPGEVVSLDIDGDATVYRDGSRVVNEERRSPPSDALPAFGRLG